MPPRLVRHQPLGERISSFINPFDLFLAFSIWLESHDWDNFQSTVANPLGLILNVLCLISRANSGRGVRRGGAGDVLRLPSGDSSDGWGSGLSYFFWILSWVLAAGSIINAVYCFSCKRRYRLFESNIEIEPTTPNARRVRVDSSPTHVSALRFFGKVIEPFTSSAESREHPDETRDVWEVSVWDPTALSLRLFALFSPAHVLVCFLSLPVASSSSLPHSMLSNFPAAPVANPVRTVFIVLVTQLVISAQLIYSQKSFLQQVKDNALIHKEVLHEYDQKYVHPRLNVLKRDVGVQTADSGAGGPVKVDVFVPTFNRQGFRTAANPNFAELTMQSQLGSMRHPSPIPARSPVTPNPFKGPTRQTKFGNMRKSTSTSTSFDGATRRTDSFDDDDDDESAATSRGEERYGGGTPRSSRSSNLGMHGLVNLARENSRNLSPSKMSSTVKRGFSTRGSTYSESLGVQLGTPGRNRGNAY